MTRYLHYDPQQTKMIAVSYGRQLLPGTFEHALSYLIDNEFDLGLDLGLGLGLLAE